MNTEDKIVVDHINKVYNMYNTPIDRLREAFSFHKESRHTEFYALTDICFSVKKGEIVGIMGRNGAGKSTLLKIITGVLKPTSGSIRLSGRVSSLLELGAGFNIEYSGIENIYFYGTIMGLCKREIDEKLDDILSFAEIGDYIYQPVKTYSSGMFARLAFSCAINVDPEILIVDEILSVGDIRFQAKCFKKFKEFKDKGVTVLYVGHDIGTMRTFCDRCIWMNQGRIIDSGDPTYISAKYVEYMYLDEITDFTSYKAFGKEYSDDSRTETKNESTALTSDKEVSEDEERNNRINNGESIAHWGTRVGLINNVSFTVNGKEVTSCSPYDIITVSFSMPHIDDIDYKYLSAAFSIKNREGIDLIVQTTYGANIVLDEDAIQGHFFSFSFQPRLSNGDYYLVLALEDRKEVATMYYEYIEGAKYFKIFQNAEMFGSFLPDIDIEIEGNYHKEQ